MDEARLRGTYRTRDDGTYCVRTIVPTGYTSPMDGPVGDLISRTEISEYRPPHVHFFVKAAGFAPAGAEVNWPWIEVRWDFVVQPAD